LICSLPHHTAEIFALSYGIPGFLHHPCGFSLRKEENVKVFYTHFPPHQGAAWNRSEAEKEVPQPAFPAAAPTSWFILP